MTKRFLSIVLAFLLTFCLTYGVFAASKETPELKTEIIPGLFEDWDGTGIIYTKYDLMSVTNVAKEIDCPASIPTDSKVFKSFEVVGSTMLTSLMDWLTITAVQINRNGNTFYELDKFYQDDAHYVTDEYGVGYYTKDSYIKLDKPGEYVIYANYMGLNLGSVGYVKIVPDETQKVMAVPTSSKILVNGKPVTFEAYNINGNNYFKLRDLAQALSGNDKQFDIAWDNNYQAITLFPGKAYTAVGGELKAGDGNAKTAVLSTARVFVNEIKGNSLDVKAYNINGNNYFKLRDIAQIIDFGVTWDAATQTVSIDTSTSYVPDK